jgi:putative phosphoesterase
MNKKIGILSDTHGVVHPGVVEVINQCDIAIHAGDIVDIKVLQKLNPKQKLVAVQGNNDTHLADFREVEMLDLPGGKIVIEHGHKHGHHQPSHDSLRETYPDAKVIVYGHTHKQVIDKDKTPWVINPGAAGEIRNHGGAKCFVIDVSDSQEWIITPYTFS